jgi:hypothetical protein
MPTDRELQPDTEDVLQVELEPIGKEPPVRVTVEGPTRTQELPHKAGAAFTRTLPASPATPTRLLRADHRRARAVLLALDQPVLIAFSGAAAADPTTMARWPANVSLVITTATDLYVASVSAAATVTLVTEMWAAGVD